ncbi:MAG: Ribonuclease BN [Desulfovibrio sp.]
MEIILQGVRGSIPSPSSSTQFYGANTPCLELRTAADDLLIFDAGSGLRLLGRTLPDSGECHLFITHGHRDHTEGLGFFRPFFNKNWTVHLYLPEWLQDLLHRYFDGAVFPVHHEKLQASVTTTILTPGDTVTLDSKGGTILVEVFGTHHPGGNLAYKVTADNATVLYTGDHEIAPDQQNRAMVEAMLKDTDLAIVDGHFNSTDLMPGWGHSAWEDWVEPAVKAQTKWLVLTHHAPNRTDAELDALQTSLLTQPAIGTSVYVAREGMRFCPDTGVLPELYTSDWLQEFIDQIGQYREESVILDMILKKTREVTFADAGTVFLLDDNELVFSYTHNDSLFPVNESSKYAYASLRLPLTVESIAGYTAVTGKSLNLPEVRDLSPELPYKFNDSFDIVTGYRTSSMLTIPLTGKNHRMMGVLQLINSLNPRTREPQPFTPEMEKVVKILAMEACKVLEVSSTIIDNVYRLLHIAALHDPTETGPHAERVGAIAAEIYQVWANKHNVPLDEALHYRSHLRLAAMIHDIGKVGISDTVLKSPRQLTMDEFEIIKTHTEKGAELFDSQYQDISELAREITLHHHQKWNGEGYGDSSRAPLKGYEIPLAARITAIADVFDALVSPRCYKEPWPFDAAIELIRNESGQHFDPELVECFLGILDTVTMIYKRFPETMAFSFPMFQVPGVR